MNSLVKVVSMILLTGASLKADDNWIQTAVKTRPEGYVDVTITNLYTEPVTAYVVVVDHTPLVPNLHRHTSVRYMDSVFSPLSAPPIAPKGSRTLTFGGPNPGPEKERADVAVKAIIFADGLTVGDPEWIDRLIRGRKSLYDNLIDALDNLRSARGTGVSYAALRQTFQGVEQKSLNATKDREEKRGASKVFETVLANLEVETWENGTRMTVDDRIAFIIERLTELRQAVSTAKPSVALH